jgi:hypothetical protein
VALAGNEGFGSLTLSIQRVKLLLETFGDRFAGVDRATVVFRWIGHLPPPNPKR